MAIGRLQVAFIAARLEALPKENAEAVHRLLYQTRTGLKLGASAAPDREEDRAPVLVWGEMGPLLAYALGDPEWQAIVGMGDFFRDLYSDMPPLMDLGASAVAREYRAHCCMAACKSNYLLYVEEDVTTKLANAARLGVGLGAVCADAVENLNGMLKRAYNDHTASGDAGGHIPRKGGGGCFACMEVVVFEVSSPPADPRNPR